MQLYRNRFYAECTQVKVGAYFNKPAKEPSVRYLHQGKRIVQKNKLK